MIIHKSHSQKTKEIVAFKLAWELSESPHDLTKLGFVEARFTLNGFT